jgi:hypothetical protein
MDIVTHAATMIGGRMKQLRSAIAGLVLPIALAAQQSAAPQANPITAAFKSNFGAMKPTIDAKDTSTPDSIKATNYMRLNDMLPPSAPAETPAQRKLAAISPGDSSTQRVKPAVVM